MNSRMKPKYSSARLLAAAGAAGSGLAEGGLVDVGAELVEQPRAPVDGPAHPEEAVDHPVLPADVDGNPVGFQPAAVGLPLVAERVVLGGDDDGWRQVVQL